MGTFNYTDVFAPDSSAIERVYYNRYSKDLIVHFVGGAGGGTLYTGVPAYVYNNWKASTSAGKFYNYEFLGKYTGVTNYHYNDYQTKSQAQATGTGEPPVVENKPSLTEVENKVFESVSNAEGAKEFEIGYTLFGEERGIQVKSDSVENAIKVVNNSLVIVGLLTGKDTDSDRVVSVKQYV